MALILILTGLALLIIALVLFVQGRKDAPQGTLLSNGRGILALTLAGLLLALASQLPMFR